MTAYQVSRSLRRRRPFTHFDDKPASSTRSNVLASPLLWTPTAAGQTGPPRCGLHAVCEPCRVRSATSWKRLLPLGSLAGEPERGRSPGTDAGGSESMYEFLPSAESILEEVVPTSFKMQVVQVFPGRGGERTDLADGGHEVGDRKRGGDHQAPFHDLQIAPASRRSRARSWRSSEAPKRSAANRTDEQSSTKFWQPTTETQRQSWQQIRKALGT